jgi:anti-anti-sigma regulatory factor
MQVQISIQKEYISFRTEVENIEAMVKKELKKNSTAVIALDFSIVKFISRSFADELLNMTEKFSGKGRSKEKIRNEVL